METTVIQEGKVVALLVGDAETAQRLYPTATVRPRLATDAIYVEPAPPAELEVTAWQLREALNQKGLRTAVEAAVAAAPQRVKDEWEFKTSYRRNHPTVLMIATAIGKTPQDIDEVFALAVKQA